MARKVSAAGRYYGQGKAASFVVRHGELDPETTTKGDKPDRLSPIRFAGGAS
jgi:hypothetical protein